MTGIYSLFIDRVLSGFCRCLRPTPKLGPVYQQVTHFVPPEFPLLLMVPGDRRSIGCGSGVRRGIRGCRQWSPELIFVVLIVAAQWPFASFLMSPASRNWVFGTTYFDYNTHPSSHYARNLFAPVGEKCRPILDARWRLLRSLRF